MPLPPEILDMLAQQGQRQMQNANAMPNPSAPQAMPTDPSGTPLSPDMGGTNPIVPNAPQSQQPKTGPLKALLTNFVQGMGQSLQYSAGIPQSQNLQAQTALHQAQIPGIQATTAETQLQTELTKRRLAAMQNMQGNDPFGSLGDLSQDEQALKSVAMQEAQMKGDPSAIHQAIKQIVSQRAIGGRSTQGKTLVTSEMAQQYPALAPFIGKYAGITDIAGLNRAEAIGSAVVQTPQGPVVANKVTGQAKPVMLNGQRVADEGIARTEHGAYAQAKYGLTKTVDEEGNPYYTSRLNAQGAAAPEGALQMFKGKAGLDNFKDALSRIDQNLDVMKDPEQRAIVAQTLRNIGTIHDPGVISSLLGAAVSSGLTPQAADLVAATLQGREFIGANRQFTGNFQGSEALYQRMVANVASPLNTPELNRALIRQDLANTARIEGRIKAFQGGRTGNAGDPNAQVPSGPNPPSSAAPPHTPKSLPDGGGQPMDANTAKAFLQAAGGDPNKARVLAKSKNWKF